MTLAPAADAQLALAHLHRIEVQSVSAGDADKRRSFKRFTIRAEGLLRPADRHAQPGQVIQIHLRDVGRGGVSFTCDQPLPAFSLWVISFTQQGIVLAQHTIQVRHIHPIDGGGVFLHGGMLVINDATLALLGVPPQDIDHTCITPPHPDDSAGDFVLPDHL